MAAPGLAIEWLGRVPYAEALARQERLVEARREGRTGDVLLLLEHPPVITLGRRGRLEHVLAPPERLAAQGIEVHRVGRGGDVTYHGPGQLVGYPIVDLAARGTPDVGAFLRGLEAVLVAVLADLGLEGYTRPGQTGVFVGPGAPGPPRKIASIGIGLRGWVTWHGFALNTSLDPVAFEAIVPCGLSDVAMTSVARERAAAAGGRAPGAGPAADLDARVRARVAARFAEAFAETPARLAAPALLR